MLFNIAKFLIKAGYDKKNLHNTLIKGGYSSDIAWASCNAALYPGTVCVNINSKSDLDNLATILDAVNDTIIKKSGTGDRLLSDVIIGIDIAYTIPERAYGRLREMGVILQK